MRERGDLTARLYTVAIDGAKLRHEMRMRGLTGVALAHRTRERGCSVSPATISHAMNGHRIHPTKFRAIAATLADIEVLPGVESLLAPEVGV